MMGGAGLLLNIARTGDDGRRIYFDTAPGIVYTVEQSTNLTSWSVLDTIVADDTNEAFYAFGTDNRYYRVIQGSDLIQFPNFHPTVEQSCYIDIYTPVQGTARVEIYANGVTPWFIVEGGIPASGHFRVSDGLYNPNNWPNDGYYSVTNWEFRVTVTPTGLSAAAANQGIVYKKGRTRNPLHKGITVQAYGVLGQATPAVEEEVDNFMHYYFLANLQSSSQVDLTGALLNEFTEAAPKLFGATSRAQLRLLMFGSNNIPKAIDRLHYFGHGTNTSFFGIRISEARTNVFCTEPFTYIALDGCKTAQTTDMLGEYTCYWKPITRNEMIDRGLTPGFGCGWATEKDAAWLPTQGALVLKHYNFWVDFYGLDGGLTHRDLNGNGYFDKTYQDAADFAKDPSGNGVNPTVQHNDESGGFVMVGCLDCFFDL